MPLEVKKLTISLPSGEPVAENISFQIEKGEMLSIVGSSGAGKTTICKAIMGLLGSAYQATGQIIFQGIDLLALHKKDRKQIYGKEICFIMQNPMTAFNPSIRVGKQLEKTYRLHHDRSSKAEMHTLFDKTLRRLGLEDTDRILKSYPFALSGGMLQRLMITAALINEPQILIADEATTAMVQSGDYGLTVFKTQGGFYDPANVVTNINPQTSMDPIVMLLGSTQPELADLVAELDSSTDETRIQEIYQTILTTIADEELTTPLVYMHQLAIYSDKITDYTFPMDSNFTSVQNIKVN